MTLITTKQINWNFVNESKPIHLGLLKTKAYTTNGARTVYICHQIPIWNWFWDSNPAQSKLQNRIWKKNKFLLNIILILPSVEGEGWKGGESIWKLSFKTYQQTYKQKMFLIFPFNLQLDEFLLRLLVVYFDQLTGASHNVFWSKIIFSAFSHLSYLSIWIDSKSFVWDSSS